MAKLNSHHIVSANREQDQVGAADRLHHRRWRRPGHGLRQV